VFAVNHYINGCIRMSKLKTLLGLLFACCIIAGIALPRCGAAEKDKSETRIKSIRCSVKGNRTCLIFDAEGAKPKQIGPPSADGISVFFSQMTAKLPDKVFKGGKMAAKEVKFRRESSFFEVLFSQKNTSVSSSVQPGKNGEYKLILELTPSAKTAEPQSAQTGKAKAPDSGLPEASVEKTPAKMPQIELKKVETSELFGSRTSAPIKNGLAIAQSAKDISGPPPVESTSKPGAFVEPDANTLSLYANANAMFEDCSRNLVLCAPEIFEAYTVALKAGPGCSLAPLAIYRSALAEMVMGKFAKADKLFRQVVSEWPDHPVACRCWLGIGEILNKKQAYVEAMEAFRWALREAAEKDDKAAAYYELGREYLTLGVNKEALEMLEYCIGQVPDYYTKKPDVQRYIGEAQFALGNLDKARERLLRFLNYQESAPDQDVVLAKVAEIFLIQGDLGAAGKLYSFIGKYYKDSEGDLICNVRQTELMEKDKPDQAIAIYNDLLGKDLSPSLHKILSMKLAAIEIRQGNPARSLELMDGAFPVKKDGSSPGEASQLREKILRLLAGQYFSKKDFMKVAQLYENYRRVFDSFQSSGALEQVAESYSSLKLYSNALEIFDKLIAKGQRKEGDLLLRCALYALRINDSGRSFQYCKLVQGDAFDLKKSEILGHIFYRDQKYAEAVKSFAKALLKGKEFEMEDPDSYEAYGNCLYKAKKFDEAVPVLQKAMEREQTADAVTRRSTMLTLSKCLAEQKQFSKAAEMMDEAIQVSGEDGKNGLMYELSKLYMAAGQTDKAMQSLIQLKASEDPFWGPVAQQQINTIDLSQVKQD